MLRTYKYRLYPTNTQARSLDFLLGQGYGLYNAALKQRITAYRKVDEGLSYRENFRNKRCDHPDTLAAN